MIFKFIHIICFLLFFFISVYSQEKVTVSGVVREKSTKEILPNATIHIASQNGTSNERGFFSMSINKGEQLMVVSFIGFKKYAQRLDFRKDTTLTIELEEGLELEEVVVLQKQPSLRNSGLGNMQLDVSQLRKMPLFLGERDVVKGMQFLPGVSSGMEGSSNLNIRGGTNDQTLYLMDDVPVYNQNHTFGLLSIFNPEILRTANLYKGGIPAMYGNRLSGVASISLKDGNMLEHHQAVSFGLFSGSLLLEGPILKNKMSYMISVRRSTLDLIEKAIVSIANSADALAVFPFHDINAKIVWNIGKKTNLSLQAYDGSDNMYALNKDTNHDEKFGYGWKSMVASLRLTSSLRSNMFLSSNLYYTHLNNFQYYQYKYKTSEGKINMKNNIYSDLGEIGLKVKIEHKTSNQNTLYYGLDAIRQKFAPDYMKKILNNKTVLYKTEQLWLKTYTAFIFDELNLGDWQFVAGVRTSLHNNGEKRVVAIEPRIKINRLLGSKNKIMMAYDYTTQPLHSVNEMNYTAHSDFWVPFQESNIASAQQFSIGWKNYSIKGLTLSIEAYWKKVENLLRIDNLENYIDYHTDFFIGKGRSLGCEFLAQYDYNRFSTWVSYTFSKSTRTFDGKTYPFKYDSPNDISAFLAYDLHETTKRTNTISINTQYHTGVPYYASSVKYNSIGMPSHENGYPFYDITSVSYIPKSPNTRLSDYFRMDINFSMEKRLKKGGRRIWQFSLLNLTGHKNPYTVYQNEKGEYKAFLLIPFLPSFSYTRYF